MRALARPAWEEPMPAPAIVALYSDVHCPYAYLTVYRLRQLRAEYQGRVTISYKSLAAGISS